jgi:hypothetical protein
VVEAISGNSTGGNVIAGKTASPVEVAACIGVFFTIAVPLEK